VYFGGHSQSIFSPEISPTGMPALSKISGESFPFSRKQFAKFRPFLGGVSPQGYPVGVIPFKSVAK
jgi:hypothetical protein